MTHKELPPMDLTAQLDDLCRTVVRTHDAAESSYTARRRELVAQLAELDRQHASRQTEAQIQFDAVVASIQKLIAAHRKQVFPGDTREKSFGTVTLKLQTHYFVRSTSKHTDSDMRLVTRANNPAGITPRGMNSLMKQITESPGVGRAEQLVIIFNDSSRSDKVVTLTSD